MRPKIAIVGMACRYPDAKSPQELWENVLAQRRAFRRIPPERLNLDDYLSADRRARDCTYSGVAALIDGYVFDRVHFRVAGSTFRVVDLTHWLALDIAEQALEDAGFSSEKAFPRETTGVVLGNTLTGEFARANLLRLRWPYVRRTIEAALHQEGWSDVQRTTFLGSLESQYKAPFPAVSEESLAGGLSNTIAGRICNHFDLKGGGYTVDGACAASLLAVTTACTSLMSKDLDVALAGGVDLSLDPFELVGFAKAGVLASQEMRIYDIHSEGFWPGEGCGFVVLMRYDDAVAQGHHIYAVIRGWGISSDGNGGITRPEAAGQSLALQRAYRRAGFGIDTVSYFEGHGTGTGLGDSIELQALTQSRHEADPLSSPAAIGSVKANIGHTKAAAGIAGLLKATLSLYHKIIPPTSACEQPHELITDKASALRVLDKGEPWISKSPMRAGVNAMGFGGINSHVVLEGHPKTSVRRSSNPIHIPSTAPQDVEIFFLSAGDTADLLHQVTRLLTFTSKISLAELLDLAKLLACTLEVRRLRAAVIASRPAELSNRLETLRSWLTQGVTQRLDMKTGVFLGTDFATPQIGYLFPGQGSPAHLSGGIWRRRFRTVEALYARAALHEDSDSNTTRIAQPAIVTASMVALRALHMLGVEAQIAVGHSLGELTALHWAGAFDEDTLLRITEVRGRAMTELGRPNGVMASISGSVYQAEMLLQGGNTVIAGFNSPQQVVVSGEAPEVALVVTRARNTGLKAAYLPVSHAFHSFLVAAAVPVLSAHLERESLQSIQRNVVSTVTAELLSPETDIRALLAEQITAPVRFTEAISFADEGLDLWIEVGPGHVLRDLLAQFIGTPVVTLDSGGSSLQGLLQAVGITFALGGSVDHKALFSDRFARPFSVDLMPQFFANPCESAPLPDPIRISEVDAADLRKNSSIEKGLPSQLHAQSPLDLIRQLVAEQTEMPTNALSDSSRLLGDLHLNSIAVSQIVTEASRRLGLPPLIEPAAFATTTILGVANALEELRRSGGDKSAVSSVGTPGGVNTWVRIFNVALVERALHRNSNSSKEPSSGPGSWQIIGPNTSFTEALKRAFVDLEPGGVVVCLPSQPDENHIDLLLEGIRVVLSQQGATRLVLVQCGGVATSVMKTLYLEEPQITTCVIDVPWDHPQAPLWVVQEAAAASGFVEAYYDSVGTRRESVLRLCPMSDPPVEVPLSVDDVLLVTGGGKGIAAECALALAQETGVRLVLIGRSEIASDAELKINLDRMAAAGVNFRYISVDVSDAKAVRAVIQEVELTFGPVTAFLHGAGTNRPQILRSLDGASFRYTLSSKIDGARNVLAAVNPDRLRMLVTFSSIIARTGMRGEADYALANAWLTHLTENFQKNYPKCRCVAIEWSVWSGVGMGERLGRVEALQREGITAITPDEGIAILRRLLSQQLPTVSVVVTGRFGEIPTLKVEQPELPLWRFLEQPQVYYPGIELIADTTITVDTDPYLDDHILQGERLFPAVMGLEAMAQAAMAVAGDMDLPVLEDIHFDRPVIISKDGETTIRVAALMREPGCVEVVLRSEETAFQLNHFRARCLFDERPADCENVVRANDLSESIAEMSSYIDLDPEKHIYGSLLFHRGRFRRVEGYRKLQTTECLAQLKPDKMVPWFGSYLPPTLLLGDPASRDAAIHAIQAC